MAVSLFILAGCGSAIPKTNAKFWSGDSSRQSIRRAQEGKEIKASDPQFDHYSCASNQDLREIFEKVILGCKEWRAGVQFLTPEETAQAQQEYQKIIGDTHGTTP